MKVIGGTYGEYCIEPHWEQIFGSGIRACLSIRGLNKNHPINFFTTADHHTKGYLSSLGESYDFDIEIKTIPKTPTFEYDYPLATPRINPRPDAYLENRALLKIKGENVLCFGMLEADLEVKADKVVYDPQSPSNPKSFSQTKSEANQLVTVVNLSEARLISGEINQDDIVEYFLKEENCYALILKMGAKGAFLFNNQGNEINIPVYKTNKIWPIGSGDVFSSIFAYCWFNGESLESSANKASLAVASYVNSRGFNFGRAFKNEPFDKLYVKDFPQKKIYLAGPFFTFSQRWLISQIRNCLRGMGLNVFSPLHEIGFGDADEVVKKDINAIKSSDLIFAVVDGLDSGTLFEIGYAVSSGKQVVGYTENETEESLKMLKGTGCKIEKDLTTAIYKTFWELCDG